MVVLAGRTTRVPHRTVKPGSGQQKGRDGKPRARQIVDPNRQSHRGKHITKRRQPHGHNDQPRPIS
jgi:hypothetical protein